MQSPGTPALIPTFSPGEKELRKRGATSADRYLILIFSQAETPLPLLLGEVWGEGAFNFRNRF